MMNIDEKKKLALEVIARLKQAYPDAACSLDYNEAWKLLVSVRLAAQCTDVLKSPEVSRSSRLIQRKTKGLFCSLKYHASALPRELSGLLRDG